MKHNLRQVANLTQVFLFLIQLKTTFEQLFYAKY